MAAQETAGGRPMKAIQFRAFGPPSVLEMVELPTPVLRDDQVLVKVAVAGVNFADIVQRRGAMPFPMPLPIIPGVEGAGTVVEVGADVTEVTPGDRVAWAPVAEASAVGSYAEYLAVGAPQLLPLPDAVSFRQGASIALQGLTASYLVNDQVPVGPGTNVLVHAAAGGMGLLLTQWLKHRGATVIGTVSTEAKAAKARAAGADHVILYTSEDFGARTLELTGGVGAHYIIDGVAGPGFLRNLEAAAHRGHICVYGMAGGPPEPFSPLQLMAKAVSVRGALMTHYLRNRQEVVQKAEEVFRGLAEGWLNPVVSTVLPLAEAARAHQLMDDRASTGKLLLTVAEET
jgi:NADPH2:quinone reductase